MRTFLATFAGVLLALLAYEGVRLAAKKSTETQGSSGVAALSDAAHYTAKQAVAANWQAVQSHVELLKAMGKYRAATDFAAAHAGEQPVDYSLGIAIEENDKDAEERLQKEARAAEENLKTGDARLSPLENSDDLLWPAVLGQREKWQVGDLRRACGKTKHTVSYYDEKRNIGGLDYLDDIGNLVHFEFFIVGVTVTYAEPKHVKNPDLIRSLNSMPCLSVMNSPQP